MVVIKIKNKMLYRVGITTDDKPVIGGVYQFKATMGMPVDLIYEDFKEKGCVIGWYDYYIDGLKEGCNPRSLKTEIESIIGKEIVNRYNFWI